MEDNRVDNEELLVAKRNKVYKEIYIWVLWQPLIKTINSALSSLIKQKSYKYYKRTQ